MNQLLRDDKQKEVEYAEIELRLRRMILELVQPTVQKTRQLDVMVKQIQGVEDHQATEILNLRADIVLLKQQVNVMDQIPLMFAEIAEKRLEAEQDIVNRQLDMQKEVDDLRAKVSVEEETMIAKLQGMEDGQQVTQATVQNALKDIHRRLDAQSNLSKEICNDQDQRQKSLETEQQRLQEEVFGEEGLSVKLLAAAQEGHMTAQRLDDSVVSPTELDARIAALEERSKIRENDDTANKNTKVELLGVHSRREFDEIHESIRAMGNEVAVHTATFIRQQRHEYQSELLQYENLRADLHELMHECKKFNSELRLEVDRVFSRTDEMSRVIRADLNKLVGSHENDQRKLDADSQATHAMAAKALHNGATLADSIAHFATVIRVLLESMKVSTRLEDDIHMRNVNLLKEKYKNSEGEAQLLSDGNMEKLKRLRANLLEQVQQSLSEGPVKRKKLPPVTDSRNCLSAR